MKPTSEQGQEWKKILWQETPEAEVRVSQGYFYDEGSFVRVVGNQKEVFIRKDKIISIQQTSRQDGRRNI